MSNLTPLETAEREIRRHILSVLDEESSDDLNDWTAFHLSVFVAPSCTKEIARAACRDLRAMGFVAFHRALWSEDGDPAGSGYALTPAGREYLRNDLEADHA